MQATGQGFASPHQGASDFGGQISYRGGDAGIQTLGREDIGAEVHDYLAERVRSLEADGVPRVWVDPGFEFAKSLDDNLHMLIDLPRLIGLERPVVISASRKGFLAELLGHGRLRSSQAQDAPGILEATVAFNVLAAQLGVHIVRVHDVAAIDAALRVVEGVRQTSRSLQSS